MIEFIITCLLFFTSLYYADPMWAIGAGLFAIASQIDEFKKGAK